jgi:hypothetical protein
VDKGNNSKFVATEVGIKTMALIINIQFLWTRGIAVSLWQPKWALNLFVALTEVGFIRLVERYLERIGIWNELLKKFGKNLYVGMSRKKF